MKLKKAAAAVLAAAVLAATPATVTLFSPFSVTANAADALKEGDYEYFVNEDGETVTITKYNGTDAVVEIPAALGGKSVTTIGKEAFRRYKSLVSVTIPSSVTTICDLAFCNCTSLTNVMLLDNVANIGWGAFSNCNSLIAFVVSVNNESYCSEDGVLFNKDKTELIKCPEGINKKSYAIPNGVTSISETAFQYCKKLTSVTIPDSVTNIGLGAFGDCTSLTSVIIPDSVISIDKLAFHGCNSLVALVVGVNNKNYCSKDGILFNKEKTELIQYPSSKNSKSCTIPNSVTKISEYAFSDCANLASITIPYSVTSIDKYAFSDCSNLTSVTIPNCVTNIGMGAFFRCRSLSSVTIPDSVTKIEMQTFGYCDSLEDVYYGGTEAQWNQIVIYSSNDALKGATIHYNSIGNEPDIPDLYTIDFDFSGVNMSIKWGGSLFEHSSSEYDNNLAIAACALSGLAENKESAQPTKDLLLKMGFSENSMKSDNFNESNPLKPAYVFANRDITVNGKTKKLVAVTIRGSQTIWGDFVVNDIIDGGVSGFSNSTVAIYKALQEYFAEKDLESVPKEDLIFFINGHSLGAAVAGRLTTKIVSDERMPQDNIFTYTIAAPKYANWGKQKKFTNLFETINKYDKIPKLGGLGSSHYGVFDEFDPNQVTDFYKYWNSWENGTLKRGELLKNHDTTVYMSYLMTKDFFINDAITPWNDKSYLISVCCPVNVEIYDTDDNLLGRVVDNVVDESVANENVFIKIEGDEKYIFVESDKEIYVKLVGTDSGTMEYSVQNLKAVDEIVTKDDIVTYKDVTLEKGKKFYSDITEKDGTADVSLYVVDPETNQFIKTVELDGTEIPLDAQNTYTITFDTNGGTSSDNELITNADGKLNKLPTANRINYVFDGWFTSVSGGAQITTDTVFTENTTVCAHWTNIGNNSGSTDSASSGSTGGSSSDSTSSNETSSDSPDSTSTNSSGDEPFDGMSSPSNGTSDSAPFSASGESSNNSNGSLCDDSGNPSNNPPTGVSVAIIPLLFAAGASMVIFHKGDKK